MTTTFSPGARNRAAGVLIILLMLAAAVAEPVLAQPDRSRELDAQFHRAETAWRTGSSLLEAKARVDRVIASLPEDVEALKLRAQVLMALNRPEEALRDARRAARLRPGDGEAHLILSEASTALRDTVTTRSAVEAALPNLPRTARLYLRLSRSALFVGAHDVAEQSAMEAMSLSPRDPMAHYQLAAVFMALNRRDSAAEFLANGVRNGLLNIDFVRRDSTLAPLLSHPLLNGISNP